MKAITFPLRLQMTRPDVATLHEALVFLGFTIAAQESTASRYGSSTRAAVAQFQSGHGLAASGAIDEATAAAINGILGDRGVLEPSVPNAPDAGGRRVAGSVVHVDGSPIGRLMVQAFHRRVGGEAPIGVEAATDSRGRYTIPYQLPAGLTKIDLLVRAYGEPVTNEQRPMVAVSSIVIGARAQEVLDLVVADERYRGPSEFAVASEWLGPQIAAATFSAVDANDVALLVRNTGIARENVTAWIASGRLAERTRVDHESLYGLIRTQKTASLSRLLRRPPMRLRRALTDAATSNLISHAAGLRAAVTVRRLREVAVELSASQQTPGSLGALLATSTATTAAQQAGFIERYASHEGPVQVFWRSLRKDPAFGDAAVGDLQLSLQLGTLVANHPPLVTALRRSGVRHASQTSTLDTEGWRKLLQTEIDGKPVGIPAGIKGASAEERQANYLTLLEERSARAFPTAHVAKTLKTLPTWQASTAVAFLDLNPDFNVLTASISSSLAAPSAVTRPEWDRATLATELATIQRVSRVSPRGKEATVVNALLGSGYTSALAIGRQSRASFRRKTTARFSDAAMADTVYHNAQYQVARAAAAYGLLHPTTGGGIVDAIGDTSPSVTSNPTWASLFGNVDYCTCEHCRSIFGPAAYLVDLLTWLDGHEAGNNTAFDLLNERRPDIQRIQLSCENTNTVMPYTDLVNEILEVRVLNPSGSRPNGPHVPIASTGTSPELLANPEYVNAQAYGVLARAVFPHILPFDLSGELGRVYFEHLGVRRSDLMETLRRQGAPLAAAIAPGGVRLSPAQAQAAVEQLGVQHADLMSRLAGRWTRSDEAIDAERLRLSLAQHGILTGATRVDVWEHWGYDSPAPGGVDFKIDLAIVSNFLHRADITYEQLLDLLHSRFVSTVTLVITGAEANTDDMRIERLTDDVLGRMHRFLRLWRNRGWSMLDVDKALHALDVTAIDGAALGRLADLDRVQDLTRAPLLEALSWWAPIDTFVDRPAKEQPVKSLYDRIYLNRAVDATAEETTFPLALNATRTALLNPVSWDDVRSIVQAALSIDADELAVLLDETVDDLPNVHRVVTGTTATLDGLSALYRHVTLARRLKLTGAELPGLLPLIGLNPFDTRTTAAAVGFIETVQEIHASSFSLVEIHYLLEHDAQAETSVGVTDEAIGQTLVEMRDGLARVIADYAIASDPVGDMTARYLAVILDATAVADVMTVLGTAADATNHADLEAVLTAHLGALLRFDPAALIALQVARRFSALLARLVPYLQETQGNAVIIEKVATFAARDLDATQDLLALRLKMVVDGRQMSALAALRESPYTTTAASEIVAADDPEAFAALRRIAKASLLLNRLGTDMDAQAWLFDTGVRSGLLNPLTLPIVAQAVHPGIWSAWTRLVDLAALSHDLPGGEPRLVDLLRLLDASGDPAAAEDAFLVDLTARTGWLRGDIDTFIAAFGPVFPDDWRDGRTLRWLVDAFALLGRLGASAAQADGWANQQIGPVQADELRLAAKSKHDEERWPAIARALRDPVREKQRAALVGLLIAQEEKYADEADLFGDLLIDVEMTPCMLTSRIKQAISSVQLFVQRAFLNVEKKIALTRDDAEEWEWRKSYRVWEAARKVFLYPENWIEPELRVDKSPLFEQLENTLLQGELNDATAEQAYTEYLEGLFKIARMEVMGTFRELEEDGEGRIDVLHVVARTKSHPCEYYYRQWIDTREWTPWERLDAEIEGDHVILAVHDRRVFLFWPMVEQRAESSGGTHAAPSANNPPTTSDLYDMRLAWIERMNGQWGARKLSSGRLTVNDAVWDDQQLNVFFRTFIGERLVIKVRRNAMGEESSAAVGSFTVDSCTGDVIAESGYGRVPEQIPASSSVLRMRFASIYRPQREGPPLPAEFCISAATLDSAGQAISDPEDILLLSKPDDVGAGAFTYLYPHQYGRFMSQHGVFLDDDECTFHVVPAAAHEYVDLEVEADKTSVSDVGTVVFTPDFFAVRAATPFESAIEWSQLAEARVTGDAAAARTSMSGGLQPGAVAGEAMALTLATEELAFSQFQIDEAGEVKGPFGYPTTTKYRFTLFYHPFVRTFMAELRRGGIAGLLDPNPEGSEPRLVRQQSSRPDFFANRYAVTDDVLLPHPIQNIDFESGGAYSDYNWELFFHAPMLIAARLSQNQRFEEARRWFHFMFDPTNRSDDEDPLRFWKIQPFYREPDAPIEALLALAASTDDSPGVDEARAKYDEQIAAWVNDPFNPHRIAEVRTTAFQKTLVMKYLDNIIAWGDQLFRRDTIESINEATGLYVLALQLLGERPDAVAPRSVAVPTTFEQVRGDLAGSVLNNPIVQLENFAFQISNRTAPRSPVIGAANSWSHLLVPRPVSLPRPGSTTQGFYFCIPPNEKLLGYWDAVEDRLFKIRHCMNIEGVVRQLPLFEPPIDPAMLVRARAAGIDLSSALADLSAPLPHYRFAVMLQKASALTQTVRALGSALLTALEKSDGEALSMLRANQEVAVLESVRQTKQLAVEEARHTLAAAERSLAVVQQRRDYFQRLIAAGLRPEEALQTTLMDEARRKQKSGSVAMGLAGAVACIPSMVTGASGVAASPVATSTVVSGLAIAKLFELGGQAYTIDAASLNALASMSGMSSGFIRRAEEWQNQLELSQREIKQTEKQIEAARVRLALAEREVVNHERQVENARSVREFMEQKFTSVELYQWMVGQLSSLYFQSYQLAYDLAKQSERGYRHELALPDATFIQFGYWDSLKKGLLAGERLEFDLQRMDAAYLENNQREYELTRHVSLALLDPVALVQLRTAGACEFSVPEALFDIDYPGHYLRRIASVSVTVPCVTGPYTTVPMRLTLVSSRTRVDPGAAGDYATDPSVDDLRFQVQTGSAESTAISSGRDDHGLFAGAARDDRYLPFEGRGVISDWSLTLTSAVPTFDWDSVTDVVLHIRYSARDGGELLRAAALRSLGSELERLPLRRAFSAKSEFASEWYAFLRPADGSPQAALNIALSDQLFPFMTRNAGLRITSIETVALVRDPARWQSTNITVTTGSNTQTVALAGSPGIYAGQPSALVAYASGAAPGAWAISIPIGQLGAPSGWIDDLMLIATYQLELELTD